MTTVNIPSVGRISNERISVRYILKPCATSATLVSLTVMTKDNFSTKTSGDSIAYHGNSLLQSIQAPILQKQCLDAVRSFSFASRRYLDEVKERQAQPGSSELQPIPHRLGIDHDLLDSQLFLQIYGPVVTTADAITDELVQTWIDSVLDAQASSFTKSDLDGTVKNLNMSMQKKDPAESVSQLFIKYHEILKLYNRHDFVKDHPKDAVGHIVTLLQPALFAAHSVDENLVFRVQGCTVLQKRPRIERGHNFCRHL
jgi:hypothetical protein